MISDLEMGAAREQGAALSDVHHGAWYQLLRVYGRVSERMAKQLAARDHIPSGWYDVLLTLEKAPGGRLRMSELADAVILSRSGLTRLVDRLEREGLLGREGCPGDKRGSYAVITEAGLAARLAAWPVLQRAMSELFAAHISDEEARVLERALKRVADAAG